MHALFSDPTPVYKMKWLEALLKWAKFYEIVKPDKTHGNSLGPYKDKDPSTKPLDILVLLLLHHIIEETYTECTYIA